MGTKDKREAHSSMRELKRGRKRGKRRERRRGKEKRRKQAQYSGGKGREGI